MSLIDINLAKKHLKADSTYEDDLVQLYLDAAESSAVQFLNRQLFASSAELDAAVAAGTAGDDPMVVNAQIKAAILLTLTDLYSIRSNTVVGQSVAELPSGAQTYLWPFRINMGV
jgi:hypothetical protein